MSFTAVAVGKQPNVQDTVLSTLRRKEYDCKLLFLEADVETAIRKRIADGCGNLYVLVNYTGLYTTHNILKRMEGKS